MLNVLRFKKLDERAVLPTRGSVHAAGLDICSIENLVIKAGNRAAVRTGLAVEIPVDYYGRVAPRSGLAFKHGIDTLAGVIDSDYRGELLIILYNTDTSNDFVIEPGQKIAQLIIESIVTPTPTWSDELAETIRGEKGFGSSGR
jgi:dUTP pyrophosphatase